MCKVVEFYNVEWLSKDVKRVRIEQGGMANGEDGNKEGDGIVESIEVALCDRLDNMPTIWCLVCHQIDCSKHVENMWEAPT